MAKESGLSFEELSIMNIRDVLEYVYAWVDFHDPEREKVRKATMEDIEVFSNG